MAMAPTTESDTQRSDLGQRFFLLGVFAILVVEALATIVNVGQAFTWTGTVLGIIATIGVLYLGNWLFTGDRSALSAMRGFVVIELILAAVALAMLVSDMPSDSPIPAHLNVSASWQGWLKVIAYGGFALALFMPGVVLDFLAQQRGETPTSAASPTAEALAPAGEPVTLAADQTKALEALSGALGLAGALLLLVGLLVMLASLGRMFNDLAAVGRMPTDVAQAASDALASEKRRIITQGVLGIAEGLLFLILGAVLQPALKALQGLLAASPRNTTLVMGFFSRLSVVLATAVFFAVALGVVVVCRFIL
jgi:hypothetical protein